MKRAAFWVAWGWDYVNEAIASAESVERHVPDLDRIICVRYKDANRVRRLATPFTEVMGLTTKKIGRAHPMLQGLAYRVEAIQNLASYDQLLFLDVDTHMCAPVYDMLDCLGRFDLMLSQSTGLRSRKDGPTLPDIFPEYNTGVVPFQNTNKVRAFHARWLEHYMNHRYAFQNSNQRSFREVFWSDRTGLRLYVLPSEYNCRFNQGMWVKYPVKILHGRAKDIAAVERKVNEHAGTMRAWRPWEIE